jgi:hypothetical protein
MNKFKKYINIHDDVLIEWTYNHDNISENYSVWTNLKTQTKSFLSTSNNNKHEYTLFDIDNVLKKYSKLDIEKYNFLKIQNYFTSPISYDKLNIFFPFNYDFNSYIGFLIKIYTYDYENKNIIYLSNYFYDKTDLNIEKLMKLTKPFRYGEREWGKYLTLSIPSVNSVSNDRVITTLENKPTKNSINYNLSNNNIGLSLTSPIFIDYLFIVDRETILNNTYYYMGDTYSSSIIKIPEYQPLSVTIKESTEWDFFEIYGEYNGSNENIDNFIRNLEEKGRRINIEYIITLYEENIQSGFPIRFMITENFSQKIEYRPIFKYSNTTASIDIQMNIIDLVDNSTISRTSTLSLTKNLFKYGKKLSRLQIDTINKPKIYNYRSDNVIHTNDNITTSTSYGITKVPYPLLISNYKILVSSSNSQSSLDDFKSNGLLNLLLTPFDNIIKFKIFKQIDTNGLPEEYDMSDILTNSKLTLIFKSDNEIVEKDIFYESDENDIKTGVVIFKISENNINIIKNFKDDDNFYLTIVGNNTKTLLYSGKFSIYENIKFINENSYIPPSPPSGNDPIPITGSTNRLKVENLKSFNKSVKRTDHYIDGKVDNNSIFNEKNIPIRPIKDQKDIDYYRNILIYLKSDIHQTELNYIIDQFKSLGLSIYYQYLNTILLERVHVSKIKNIENINHIDNIIKLKLNFGWYPMSPPLINNKNDS